MIRQYSDSEIKQLFSIVKGLMFWPHPGIYDPYKEVFHIQDNTGCPFETESKKDLTGYVKKVDAFLEHFPLSVYIEVTNRCNLNCIMCPNRRSTRQRGQMEWNTFKKIVDEIAEKQPYITTGLYYMGEPLVDSLIFDRISYCKKAGLGCVKLSTNGSLLLKDENYKRLIDSGVDMLIVSIDAVSKKCYESIRKGSSFDRFQEGLKKLVSYNRSSGSRTRIIGSFIGMDSNKDQSDDFHSYIREQGIEPFYATLKFWGDHVPGLEGLDEFRYCCNNPLYSAVILWDGSLAACCVDYDGKGRFGNVNGSSVEKLWKEKHVHLRKSQLDGKYDKYDFCSGCSDWMNFGYNRYADILNECRIKT